MLLDEELESLLGVASDLMLDVVLASVLAVE